MTGKQVDQILVDIINDKGVRSGSGTDGDASTRSLAKRGAGPKRDV